MTQPTDPALDHIVHTAKALEQARLDLDQAVAAARAQGIPWAQIGKTFGVSRQAVWERFGARVDELHAPTTKAS